MLYYKMVNKNIQIKRLFKIKKVKFNLKYVKLGLCMWKDLRGALVAPHLFPHFIKFPFHKLQSYLKIMTKYYFQTL